MRALKLAFFVTIAITLLACQSTQAPAEAQLVSSETSGQQEDICDTAIRFIVCAGLPANETPAAFNDLVGSDDFKAQVAACAEERKAPKACVGQDLESVGQIDANAQIAIVDKYSACIQKAVEFDKLCSEATLKLLNVKGKQAQKDCASTTTADKIDASCRNALSVDVDVG